MQSNSTSILHKILKNAIKIQYHEGQAFVPLNISSLETSSFLQQNEIQLIKDYCPKINTISILRQKFLEQQVVKTISSLSNMRSLKVSLNSQNILESLKKLSQLEELREVSITTQDRKQIDLEHIQQSKKIANIPYLTQLGIDVEPFRIQGQKVIPISRDLYLELFDGLKLLKALTVLSLNGFQSNHRGLNLKQISDFHKMPNLKILKLKRVKLQDSAMRTFGDSLNHLEEVSLNNCQFNFNILCQEVQKMKQLKGFEYFDYEMFSFDYSLRRQGSPAGYNLVLKLIKSLPPLKKLGIADYTPAMPTFHLLMEYYNKEIANYEDSLEVVISNRHPDLEELKIYGSSCNQQKFCLMIKCLKSLKSLSLLRRENIDQKSSSLCQYFIPIMGNISLNMIAGLAESVPNLKVLQFNGHLSQQLQLTPKIIQHIGKSFVNLEQLHAQCCCISDSAIYLGKLKKLKVLKLSKNNVPVKIILKIALTLKNLKHLRIKSHLKDPRLTRTLKDRNIQNYRAAVSVANFIY